MTEKDKDTAGSENDLGQAVATALAGITPENFKVQPVEPLGISLPQDPLSTAWPKPELTSGLDKVADALANIEPATGKRLTMEEQALEALEKGWGPITPTSLGYTPPKLDK